MADSAPFNAARFDLLVLPHGESFPLAARNALRKFLSEGGDDLLTMGGYAFQSPLVREDGKWRFYDEVIGEQMGPNLIGPPGDQSSWKANNERYASIATVDLPSFDRQSAVRVAIPYDLRGQIFRVVFRCSGEVGGGQSDFAVWVRALEVRSAPDGSAYIGIDQLDEKGEPIWGPGLVLEELRGSREWHKIERLICVAPGCVKLCVHAGVRNASGEFRASRFSLEPRAPAVRINTSSGYPLDELQIEPRQIGMFDADFRLKRVTSLWAAAGQSVLADAAQGLIRGLARRVPLLEAYDAFGRKRGAAGALDNCSSQYREMGQSYLATRWKAPLMESGSAEIRIII